MADLTSGRLIPCLDSKAGVETIYLGKWVRDSGVIDLNNEITFTLPIIFHEYQARDIQVTETLQHSDEGEIYQFSINVDLQGIDKETSKELNVLCDLLLLAIVQFENGNQKVYGFSSGLDVGLTETSGGGKSSFSGYNLKLKGEDEKIPYFGGVLPIEYPFFLDANGVTIKLKEGYSVGATGLAEGDTSGKVYTAVNRAMLLAMNPSVDDFTSVCTTLVGSMSGMFNGQTNFNQDISSWDMSNVTNVFIMFRSCTNFNQDISFWDMSNVTIFESMFRSAANFNQNIGGWDVSSGVNFESMFRSAASFNQNIGGWDVSSAINMDLMFENSLSFNQDLSTWCVAQIPTEPTDFATGTPAWVLPKPNWGAPC